MINVVKELCQGMPFTRRNGTYRGVLVCHGNSTGGGGIIISRFFKLVGLAGALLLISACTVGPNYVKPTTVAPGTYKEMKDWKVAEPKDHVMRGKWWEIYNDPQLNALEEQVNISNQNIFAAEAKFRQARALIQVARAAYFPTITMGPSFTRFRPSTTITQGATSSPSPTSLYSLQADATWELDLWGRVRRSVEASKANAQASAADLEGVRLSTHAQLAQSYFQLRAQDALKQILDETVITYQKSLELTQNRYASGVASRADVLQAEAQLKSTQAQAIEIGVQRAQLEHAIAVLIGKQASLFSVPFSPLANVIPPAVPVGIPSELLERRPDIASAERLMASANAQIGVAKAAYYPTVSLNASGGFQSIDLAKWFNWPSLFWSVGPVLAETLFSGGLRQAQIEQARAAYEATVGSYRETVLIGFQEVEDYLAALRILEQEELAQEEAVKAAVQSVTVVTNQYKAGIVGYLNVIVVQALALNDQTVAVNILGSRMTDSVLLIKALGGGWTAAELSTP